MFAETSRKPGRESEQLARGESAGQQACDCSANNFYCYVELDIAFNNAGIQVPVAETADARGENFDRGIAINLRGIWNCMKYELRHMRERGTGAIVNCSSTSGLIGTAGLGAYTAIASAPSLLLKTAK